MHHRTVVTIDLAAIRHNVRRLAERSHPAAVIPTVKADAYGHGAVEVSRTLAADGTGLLAVVSLDEALELRDSGITAGLLVLGVCDPARVAQAAAAGIILTIHDLPHAEACIAEARALPGDGSLLRCHVHADTGMHRLGVDVSHAARVVAALHDAGCVRVDGLMTHLARADEEDLEPTRRQLDRFRELIAALAERGLRPPLCHAANSAAAVRCPEARFDAVRAGIAVYGVNPCPQHLRGLDLRLALTVSSVVAQLRDVPQGEGIGYGHTWHASRPSRIAAVPIGYHDGYWRALSNRARVRVAGRLAPVVGRVSMDTTLVDVTDVPEARVGTEVVLVEPVADSPLSVYALAAMLETIPYEVLCRTATRPRRVFVDPEA